MMSSAKNTRVTERDLRVVELLEEYKLLTTSQIQQLVYPTLQKAQTRLLRLFEAGLVKRFSYPVLLREGGKGEYVYHVKRRRSGAALTLLQHTLAVNDVRIAFELGCRESGQVRLVAFIPEYMGKARENGKPGRAVEERVERDGAYGQEALLIPDAVICLENRATKKRALFFLEVDLGSEKLVAEGRGKYSVLKKMLLYREYLSSRGFERYSDLFRFRFKGFRVLALMNNAQRIQKLRRELTQRDIRRFVWLAGVSTINRQTLFEKVWLAADANDNNRHSIQHD